MFRLRMLGAFRVLRSFWKPSVFSLTKKTLFILVIFLFLVWHIGLGWQFWQMKKQNTAWQAEARVKLDQLQSNSNYSSSLLWTMKNQLDQLPYQIRK